MKMKIQVTEHKKCCFFNSTWWNLLTFALQKLLCYPVLLERPCIFGELVGLRYIDQRNCSVGREEGILMYIASKSKAWELVNWGFICFFVFQVKNTDMPQILACAIKNHSACARLSKQSDWDTTCTLFKTLLFWGGWQHTAPENYTAIHYLNIKHSSTCFNHVPRNSSTVPLCSANPSWLSLLEKYILFFYFFFQSRVNICFTSTADVQKTQISISLTLCSISGKHRGQIPD